MAGELGFSTGPYVAVATFVNDVLEEKSGALSLVRIVNQLSIEAEGPEVPDELPPGVVNSKLVVVLRAGEARGPQRVQIVLETPDGARHDGAVQSVNFPAGKHATVQLVTELQFGVESAGLYWADVLVNDRLVSRAPLEVQYGFRRS